MSKPTFSEWDITSAMMIAGEYGVEVTYEQAALVAESEYGPSDVQELAMWIIEGSSS